MKELLDHLRFFAPFILMAAIFLTMFGMSLYKCCNPDTMIHYGDENYIFVIVSVGSGRSNRLHAGSLALSDYEKWVNGEAGTIFLWSTVAEGKGYYINTRSITYISNYGNSPSFLPMNFV